MIKLAILPQSILLGISLLLNNSLPLLAQSTPLSVDNLRNTVYNIPNRGSVILSDGIFQSNEGPILGVQVSREALMGDYNNDQRTDGIVKSPLLIGTLTFNILDELTAPLKFGVINTLLLVPPKLVTLVISYLLPKSSGKTTLPILK